MPDPTNGGRANGWAIDARSLRRTFKPIFGGTPFEALVSVDLTVPRGELFGLLGPNGAGKTTLIKILSTLLLPTSGTAHVLGLDVATDFERVRPRIAMVSGGENSGYGLLTVRENLWMFAQFYGVPTREAMPRIDRMIERLGMTAKAHTKISELSTGQRQRMNIIRGFISNPNVLFLDEPTLGLDVQAAREIRGFVREWMAEDPDRTVLLTTHYMFEADELCHRIAIIDHGKILSCDSPRALRKTLGQAPHFTMTVAGLSPGSAAIRPAISETGLETFHGIANLAYGPELDGQLREISFSLENEALLPKIIASLTERNVHLVALSKRESTLEDVFVSLVGRRLDS